MGRQLTVVIILGLIALAIAQTDTIAVFSLQECINSALQSSPTSARIEAENTQIYTNVYSSLSPVLPYLSISSGWNRSGPQVGTLIDVPGGPPITTEGVSLNNFQTSFSFAQTLVDIASFVQVKQIPNINSLATNTFQSSRADLAYNVKQQYYGLLVIYSNVSVSETAVKQFEQQAQVASEKYRLGVISRPELLRVEVALLQQRVENINTTTSLQNGLRTMAYLIGEKYPIAIDTSLSFPDTLGPLPPQDSLIELLIQSSPSYQISKLNLETRKSTQLASKLNILPSINGTFTYGYSAPHMFGSFSDWKDNDFWSVGIDLTWSIFERLSWYSQLKDAQAQTQIATADLALTRTSLTEEMDQAYANLQAAQATLLIVPDLLEQATEELRLTMEQFRLGAAAALDLLQSQLSFIQAQQQVITAITDFYLAQAKILQLLGQW